MRNALVAALSLVLTLPSMPRASAADAQQERLRWWTEARFGMFIHWGIYTVPAGEWNGRQIEGLGEWIMNRGRIPVADYAEFTKQFNPVKFNADEWVRLAKAAGQKFTCDGCHKDLDTYALTKNAQDDYKKLEAAQTK